LSENYSEIHKSLIEDSKKGKRKAQTKLYNLYARSMFNICVRMSSSMEEAEDLLQDAFSEAFHKLDTFQYESSFGAWLKRIVINKCINALKAKKADLTFTEQISDIGQLEDATEIEDFNNLKVKQIVEAMKKLPDGYKAIFTLYLIEGYTHNEIADFLNISVSTSKTQYLRAKKKLIEILGENKRQN